MKMIWITQESLLPLNTGGRIGVFKRLEQLYRENEIYLFYTYDKDEETVQISELKKFCKGVYAYPRKRNLATLFRCLRYPFCIASRSIKKMRLDLERCITENEISIINVDFPQMCVNLFGITKRYPVKFVLNEHNIEFQFYSMISRSSEKFLKKSAYAFDSKRLKRFEEKLFKKINFDAVTFVSDKDMAYHREWIKTETPRFLVPVGADEREGVYCFHANTTPSIIFVGKMSADTNAEGVLWFAREVFPFILTHYPQAKFFIIGKDPTDTVKALKGESIFVTGEVESLEEYYDHADLVVIPLLHGGGVKIKLLEAVSYKRPIVTTDTGIEGTLFQNNVDVFVQNEPKAFAEKCLALLSDKTKAELMVENAYEKYIEHYTWKKIGEKYQKILDAIK